MSIMLLQHKPGQKLGDGFFYLVTAKSLFCLTERSTAKSRDRKDSSSLMAPQNDRLSLNLLASVNDEE